MKLSICHIKVLVLTITFSLLYVIEGKTQDRMRLLREGEMRKLGRVQGRAQSAQENLRLADSAAIKKAVRSTSQDSLKECLPKGILKIRDSSLLEEEMKSQVERVEATATQEFEKKFRAEGLTEVPVDSGTLDLFRDKVEKHLTGAVEDKAKMKFPDDFLLDSASLSNLKEKAVNEAEAALKNSDQLKAADLGGREELDKLARYKDELEKAMQRQQQEAALQKIREKMTGSARGHIEKHTERIQQVQNNMGLLKKKYTTLLNSNDLTTGIKRASLAGQPFHQRLVIGGNINITKIEPVMIDISPVLGYRFNKLFAAGFSYTYRAELQADRSGIADTRVEYGYGIFTDHFFYRNFFGHLEGETRRITPSANTEHRQPGWNQALLVGIGREFKITEWLKMQAMLLYNALHNNEQLLYKSPILFKTGFRVRSRED